MMYTTNKGKLVTHDQVGQLVLQAIDMGVRMCRKVLTSPFVN